MRVPSMCITILSLLVLASSALAQDVAAERAHTSEKTYEQCVQEFGSPQNASVGYFPQYALSRVSPDSIQTLRRYLQAECWEHALWIYFPQSRRARFADWIVYIDSAGGVRQGMTKGTKERTEFRGEKYVWGIVFSDRYIAPSDTATVLRTAESKARREDEEEEQEGSKEEEAKQPAGELEFRRRSVNYQRDPALTALFKSVTGQFFTTVEPAATAALADSTKIIELRQFSADTTCTSADTTCASMYVAQDRYGLAENTEVVLSLRPSPGREFPGRLRSIYANLGNSAPSLWEVGISGGASFGSRTQVLNADTLVVGTRSGVQPNIYLTAYLNLVRPRLPWRRFSLGPVVGMNLARGGVFDELIAGLAIGRVLGDAGLIVGASGTNVTKRERGADGGALRRREERDIRAFAGIDFRL